MNNDSPDNVFLNIERLFQEITPLSAWHELSSPITKEEVELAVKNGTATLSATPIYLSPLACPDQAEARQNHINKIAYFVIHDAEKPISIEFSEFDMVYINDGNHRLCGKYLRGDPVVEAEIGGFLDSFLLDVLKHNTSKKIR